MILEEETFNEFGYYPKDLKEFSNKKILCICNKCGKIRSIRKDAYRDMCHSCALKSNETKLKMSEAHMNHIVTSETREKIGNAQKGIKSIHFGKSFSEETKQKMSESRKGFHFTEESKLK